MLEVRGLAKSFAGGAPLFAGLDLALARGEWLAIVGESGSGKSTLLNVIAGLERPDAGEVRLEGRALDFSDDDALALWRRAHVGFVFQSFHLLPYLDVRRNVELPLALLLVPGKERERRALEALDAVGLAGFGARRPGSLSGGEMQRVAIARALVHRPALVLADEPTGNLDEGNAGAVLECLRGAAKSSQAATLMVTHSMRAASAADRVLRLSMGRIAPASS
ncbi:MAG TPA: ABC transporter ATP-binding protein [Usitatibacter sp.]|jgi:putative ABC transport system ATP-binding protein|nr:ABC transporter ATP-binding protein [Usitatibacter sp.]